MKTLNIEVPEGYEIDKDKSTFERIVFKEVKEKLSYEDISNKLFIDITYYINTEGDIPYFYGNSSTPINQATTREQLESILALNKLCNVAKYLNGDWLPDKKRYDTKWFIAIQFEDKKSDSSSLSINKHETVMYSCVYFKEKRLAQQAIDTLGEEEIRKALTLNH
jgi:hypothetical protein